MNKRGLITILFFHDSHVSDQHAPFRDENSASLLTRHLKVVSSQLAGCGNLRLCNKTGPALFSRYLAGLLVAQRYCFMIRNGDTFVQ